MAWNDLRLSRGPAAPAPTATLTAVRKAGDVTLGVIEPLVDHVVERSWHIRPEPGWIVVPVEKGRHFEADDAARVAAAIGDERCFEDYNLIAGPEQFVTACLRTDVQDARARFRRFAADPWFEGRLLEVAERYS